MNLTATKISKRYMRDSGNANFFEPVKETSLELEPGSFTMLCGRSGCGKTTLVSMLSGLLEPSSGTVFLDGKDIYSLDDKSLSALRNRHFGIIPQGESALHALTVIENVLLPTTLFPENAQGKDIKKRADMLLDKFGISSLKNARPAELSGGELRRMAIARALILDPEIIIADEPTGDLDDENTTLVFNSLRELADTGHSVLVVTHEAQGRDFADRVFRMDAGVMKLG